MRSPSQSGARCSPTNFRLVSSTSPSRIGTLQDILGKSSKGCRFCNLLITSVHPSSNTAESNPERLYHLQQVTCYISWEVDGRGFVKTTGQGNTGKEPGQNTVRGLTRRIHITWDDPRLNDCYLMFVAREKYLTTASDAQRAWSSASLFLGRRIEGGGNIQARLRSWLDLCREKHKGPCVARSPKTRSKFSELLSHSYFGVVDVMNMQLTELPRARSSSKPPPYAALSYVWGLKRTFTTKLENVNLLRMHGGVEKILPELPKIIRDAIDLVRRLGIQYVWVDSLCIIQDSDRSWKLNAYNMDSIYGNAELTICAADGKDASAGLRAMSPGNNPSRQEIAHCLPGVNLMISRPPERYIKASKWNLRHEYSRSISSSTTTTS